MTDLHPPVAREVALPVAEAIRDHLLHEKVVVRAEVAGSLRRKKDTVHDVEVVVELPTFKTTTLDGGPRLEVAPVSQVNLSGELLESDWAKAVGILKAEPPFARAAFGPKYRKLRVGDLQVDLFVVTPPAQFAPIFAVRTGAASFGEEVVKRFHRYGMKLEEGRLIRKADGATIDCPTEELYFAFAQLPCLPPEKRDLSIPETWELFKR
jgi:DNA polymerase/3'-5' exonuclease PolX